MSRLLVTGAAGYLGSHLMQTPTGREKYGTYHLTPPPGPLPVETALSGKGSRGRSGDSHWVQLDLRDEAATRTLFLTLRPQAVIHTALSNHSAEQISGIALAARNVALAARDVGARLVHLSTDLIWDGERPPYAPGDPPTPLGPYGRAKAEAEAIVGDLCPEAAIVRPSLIWGLDPVDRQTAWMVRGIQAGERVTLFTDEYRQPVYVRALVAALLELAGNKIAGPLNMGGGQRLNRWEFGQRLLAALRRRRPGILPPELPAGEGQVVPGLVADSGLTRARDLTMKMDDTHRQLSTPLPGVDEVLATLGVEQAIPSFAFPGKMPRLC